MNIFLHFKVCYIYEDKKCPYGKHSESSQGPAVVRRQVHTLQFTKKKKDVWENKLMFLERGRQILQSASEGGRKWFSNVKWKLINLWTSVISLELLLVTK